MTRTKMSTDYITSSLKALFGTNVTAADIKGWCAANGANYQTVTNKIEEFKVSRGRWNLEVTQQKVEEIERSFNKSQFFLNISKTLFLIKMIPSSSLVTLTILKKLFSPVFFILHLLRVCRVTVKRSVWSKRVLNLSVNLFV